MSLFSAFLFLALNERVFLKYVGYLLVFAGAETPFADGFFRREYTAHARLLEVLLDETTASERLVLAGIDLARPEPLPAFSAAARNGVSAPAASGNCGGLSETGPTSRISRLTMPRAGRPVNRLVSAVASLLPASRSACRCSSGTFASGERK